MLFLDGFYAAEDMKKIALGIAAGFAPVACIVILAALSFYMVVSKRL